MSRFRLFNIPSTDPEPSVELKKPSSKMPERTLFKTQGTVLGRNEQIDNSSVHLTIEKLKNKKSPESLEQYLNKLNEVFSGKRLFALKDVSGKQLTDSNGKNIYFISKSLARITRDYLSANFSIQTNVIKGVDHDDYR